MCALMRASVCPYLSVHVSVCLCVCVCVVCVYVCVCVSLSVHVYVCMCVCLHAFVFMLLYSVYFRAVRWCNPPHQFLDYLDEMLRFHPPNLLVNPIY